MKRGEIYFADLSLSIGSELRGIRPIIIASNDKANEFSNVVTVIPISSSNTKKMLPTHVKLEHMQLKNTSFAMVEQIRTIEKIRIFNYLGRLDNETMKKIDKSIKIQLDLN